MLTPVQHWTILAVVVLNAYSLGANCVERFVNYQSWPKLDTSSFSAYHRAQQPYILGFIVAPLAVSFVLQLALVFNPPASIGFTLPIALVVSTLAGSLSTAFLQIPIHRELSANGYSSALVSRLLATDWIRKACDLVRIVATIALLNRLLA